MSQQFLQATLQPTTWVAAGLIALGLGSCATPPAPNATEPSDLEESIAPEDTLQIVTTILPITQFTTAVAGDRAEVIQLLPTNTGPHDYQARPSDVQVIAKADVLVKNGLGTEFFLNDMIENAENADLAIIESSEGIETLASSDDHVHSHSEGEKHSEEEDHAEEHDEHAHSEFDPHIWLDPKRAIEQVENIRDGLIAADLAGEAAYTTNADAFISQLTVLDADISETFSPFEGETFVILHDFASYFADSYGLQFTALVGIPEESPSPEDVQRVIETVRAEGLKTILTEPQSNKESFEAITDDLGISLSVFDPMETGDATATQPDYYIKTMRQNAENLAAGFESSN